MNLAALRFGADYYRAGCIVNRNQGLENMQVVAALTGSGPILRSMIYAGDFHKLI